jgi:ketosteroid isomerase-like protein
MSDDPAAVIPQLEREWMNGWLARDRDTCARILGDDFLLTSARGVLMTKTEWLAALDSIVGESFQWEEIRVRPFGDLAVVHCRTKQRASVAGHDWSGRFLLTDVWVRRDGRWQVVSRHGTGPLPDSAPKA